MAQGVSNLMGSFMSCLPMSGSLSRSLVQVETFPDLILKCTYYLLSGKKWLPKSADRVDLSNLVAWCPSSLGTPLSGASR